MTGSTAETLDLADIQGLLIRGYGNLPEASFVLFRIDDLQAAATVLISWADTVTSALSRPNDIAVQLALTSDGIAILAGSNISSGFSEQFTTGMATTYRSRLLGDVDEDDPGKWNWGGPNTDVVHVLMMLYASSESILESARAKALSEATGGMTVVACLNSSTLSDREPFGFHDGISQPLMKGLPRAADSTDAVSAGEFVLGYINEYGQRSERPLLPPLSDGDRILPRDADGTDTADLGRNGSYLVLRQLEQDVAGFHEFVDRASRDRDGVADESAASLLAAKMVGRWPSGAPLVLDPDSDNPVHSDRNDFAYQALDPDGLSCPIGSHIRRSNPRDSLDPKPGTSASVAINHKHRILRRGRAYGAADFKDSGAQGLYFVCLNSNLARQFEFIQHSWLNDPGFNLLDDAADPLVGTRNGSGGTFTVPAIPLRKRYRELPQFVRVRGGAYFFLPGINALRFFAQQPLRDKPVSS